MPADTPALQRIFLYPKKFTQHLHRSGSYMGSMVYEALKNVTIYLSLYIPIVRGFKRKFKFGVGKGGRGEYGRGWRKWEGAV